MTKHYGHHNHYNKLHIPDHWEHYWSKYPNGYTLLEALISWTSQVNDMIVSYNHMSDDMGALDRNFRALDKELRASWVGYKDHTEKTYTDFREELFTILNNWIATIEPTIQDTIVSSLSGWLADGTLADIINNDVFDMKANQTDLDNVTTQLAQTMKHKLSYINVSQPPYNVVGDGVTDETSSINQAITDLYNVGGGTLYIPFSNQPYMVNAEIGINLKDNVNMVIDDGSIFKAIPTAKSSYRVISLVDTKNNNIYGNYEIIGERNEHLGTTGEWGMGVEMRGASNIYFEHIHASDCWGDGLYIGSSETQNYCKNITIGTLIADNNRRQGFSLISVKGLTIDKAILTNTNGTAPEAGLDFEPNNNLEFLQDIKINKLITKGNKSDGVLFYFGTYLSSPNLVDITINEFHSDGDYVGVSFSSGGDIQGAIKFTNQPIIENSGHYGINQRNWPSTNPRITFDRPIIKDPLVDQTTTSDMYASAIIVTRLSTDTATGVLGEYIGNIELIQPIVMETRMDKRIQTSIFIKNEKQADQVEKVAIIDPIRLDGIKRKILHRVVDLILSDKYNNLVYQMNDEDVSINSDNFNVMYTTEGNTTPMSLTLSSTLMVGAVITIVLKNDQKLTVKTSNRIYPLESSFGKWLSANKQGAKITLRKIEYNKWEVINVVGTWTEETAV